MSQDNRKNESINPRNITKENVAIFKEIIDILMKEGITGISPIIKMVTRQYSKNDILDFSQEFAEALRLSGFEVSNVEVENTILDVLSELIDFSSKKEINHNTEENNTVNNTQNNNHNKEEQNSAPIESPQDITIKLVNLVYDMLKKESLTANLVDKLFDFLTDESMALETFFELPYEERKVILEELPDITEKDLAGIEIISLSEVSEDGTSFKMIFNRGRKKEKDVIKGLKIDEPVLKISFLGMQYTWEYNKKGRYIRDDKAQRKAGLLNFDGEANLHAILDQDIMHAGAKMKATIKDNWEDAMITDYLYDENGERLFEKMIMRDWMKKHDIKEGDDTWLSYVPMDVSLVHDSGDIALGSILHSVDWWNERNVAGNKDRGLSQEQVIEMGRKKTLAIRKKIYENKQNNQVTELTVTQVRNGTNDTTQENKSLDELNIDYVFGYSHSSGILLKKGRSGKGHKYFKGEILNQEYLNELNRKYDNSDYQPFILLKAGSKIDENGKKVDQYIAVKAFTNFNADLIEKANTTREAIFSSMLILAGIKPGNPLFRNKDKAWAKRVQDGVKKLTKITLGVPKVLPNGKLSWKGTEYYKIANIYPRKGENEKLGLTVEMDSKGKSLPFAVVDPETGEVFNYSKTHPITNEKVQGYDAFLGSALQFTKNFFEITDQVTGEKKHIIDYQPIIEYTYDGEQEIETPVDAVMKELSNRQPIERSIHPKQF